MSISLILAVIVFTATLYVTIEVITGLGKIGDLQNVTPYMGTDPPKVSIIVPALNEEKTIELALLSLLNQEYENIEIIVINDRSTDKTGEVLRRVKHGYPELRVYELQELADGWLGKNKALDFGADQANGEYLVFTDADVIMKKSTIGRAVAMMQRGRLDHLSLFFKNIAGGWILNSMIIDAGASLLLLFKPWRVRDLQCRYFMGVGAFNMVRAEAYRAVGGHRMIRIHPIDDIMLGKIMKRYGCRQDSLLGHDFVSVRWYDSVGGMVDGLMKNAFALMGFRVSKALVGVGIVVLLSIVPPWGFLLCEGLVARLFFLAAISLRGFLSLHCCKSMKVSAWNVVGGVISPYISCYIVLKSVYLTMKNGGICWRGTKYSLEEMKKTEPVFVEDLWKEITSKLYR